MRFTLSRSFAYFLASNDSVEAVDWREEATPFCDLSGSCGRSLVLGYINEGGPRARACLHRKRNQQGAEKLH